MSRLYNIPIITKTELENLIQKHKNEYILIDVRTPEETRTNVIETAKKIPLQELPEALSLDEDAFEEKYQFNKPKFEDLVIFYCRVGVRSQTASEIAKKFGYKNVKNYKGSALEWFGS